MFQKKNKYNYHVDGRTMCKVCLCPFRREIERFLAQGISQHEIATNYIKFFSCSIGTLRSTLSRHKTRHLGNPTALFIPEAGTNGGFTPTRVEAFAQRLLDLSARMVEISPEKVHPRDVVMAQRLLMDKKAFEDREQATRVAIARIFGGIEIEVGKISSL